MVLFLHASVRTHSAIVRRRSWTLLRAFGPHELLTLLIPLTSAWWFKYICKLVIYRVKPVYQSHYYCLSVSSCWLCAYLKGWGREEQMSCFRDAVNFLSSSVDVTFWNTCHLSLWMSIYGTVYLCYFITDPVVLFLLYIASYFSSLFPKLSSGCTVLATRLRSTAFLQS